MSRTLGTCLLLALAVTACTDPETPCERAAAQLTACSDDQRDAFVESCEASGVADTATLSEDDAAAMCAGAPDDGKQDAQTTALTGVCVAAMYTVKWGVTLVSPTGLPLSESSKQTLRPLFGDLVDDVRISIGARLPPAIRFAGHELSIEPGAMTFGNDIFIRSQVVRPDDPANLFYAVIHEMTHSQQAKAAGGYYGFAVNYCRSMIATNYDYYKIDYEVAAYRVASDAETSMNSCHHLTCP
jgi:hypothetical protein